MSENSAGSEIPEEEFSELVSSVFQEPLWTAYGITPEKGKDTVCFRVNFESQKPGRDLLRKLMEVLGGRNYSFQYSEVGMNISVHRLEQTEDCELSLDGAGYLFKKDKPLDMNFYPLNQRQSTPVQESARIQR